VKDVKPTMNETILFTKPGCTKCDWIKAHCDLTGIEIQELTDNNAEALGLLAYYECVTLAEKALPILVLGEDEIVSDFALIKERLSPDGATPDVQDCGDSCRL
jgi:hypothetical protein